MRPPKKPRHSTRPAGRIAPEPVDIPALDDVIDEDLVDDRGRDSVEVDDEPQEAPRPREHRLANVRSRLATIMASKQEAETVPSQRPQRRRSSSSPFSIEEHRSEKAKKKRKSWLVRGGIALATIIIAGVAVWLFFFSSFFTLERDKIELEVTDSAGVMSGDEVWPVIESYVGTPILRVDKGGIEEQLVEIPEVESATVATSFPSGMTVTLVGAQPVACLTAQDSCEPVTKDAVALSRITPEALEALPRITMGEGDSAGRLAQLLDALAALPDQTRSGVDSAAISDTGLIEFAVGSSTVKWGESVDNDKKAEILAILVKEPASLYDVSVPSAPVTR